MRAMPGPLSRLVIGSVVGVLAACSGGGGDTTEEWLTYTPATLAGTSHMGESVPVSIAAHSTRPSSRMVNLLVVDGGGVFSLGVTDFYVRSQQDFTATLHTLTTAAAGTHTGYVELQLCYDDPAFCAEPVPDSTRRIPFTVEIVGFDLRPLEPIPGVDGWTTYGGNAAHTPHVPATFDAAAFDGRWWRTLPSGHVTLASGMIAVDSGRVYLETYAAGTSWVHAYSEDTGELVWSHELPGAPSSPPAAAGGRVFVVTGGKLLAVDGATGSELYQVDVPADAPVGSLATAQAPTPYAGDVYVGYGNWQPYGIAKFAAASGAFERFLPMSPDNAIPAVAIRGGLAFSGTASGQLVATSTSDGSTAWTATTHPDLLDDWTFGVRPVGDRLVCTRGGDQCVDPTTQQLAYEGDRLGSVQAAIGSTLFESYGGVLQANDVGTGALLWSWDSVSGVPEQGYVFTDNLVFARKVTQIVAVDLTTHQEVWSVPLDGELAISDRGVLYVLSSRLVAINLR